MENKEFYDFLIKVQSVAKMGLVYSKDPYALDNYHEINDLSKAMLEKFQHIKFDRNNYFTKEVYPTPNISVRTVIFNKKGQVLMVKEAVDGGYSLPGGWCDLYESSSQTAKKESLQEAGVKIKNLKLVGLFHQIPFRENVTVPAFVVVYRADLDCGDTKKHCYEITDVDFFDPNHLPKLSFKCTKHEIMKMIKAAKSKKVIFD
ncbi:MAG: NUDIX hydrolase N-terminal domain-containing protein [Bacilli bacterium]|nr:NUDIX hydrolase N-terminal domain-containing protein [Bacilli bacterium]